MALVEITGVLHAKFDIKEYGKKKNYLKREAVIAEKTYGGGREYTELIKFYVDGAEGVNTLDDFSIGDIITVSGVITGREWPNPEGEIIYFTGIKATKIESNRDLFTKDQVAINPKEIDYTEQLIEMDENVGRALDVAIEKKDKPKEINDLPF